MWNCYFSRGWVGLINPKLSVNQHFICKGGIESSIHEFLFIKNWFLATHDESVIQAFEKPRQNCH